MGYIKFKNGVTLVVGASWVINMVDGGNTTLCGTGEGLEMRGDSVRVNEEKNGSLYINDIKPNNTSRGLFKGENLTTEQYEAKQWIYSVINDKDPLTKLDENYVVSKMIEAIYESAATGKTIYFE